MTHDDLPPDLADLFAAERARPGPPPEAAQRVHALLAQSLGAAAVGAAPLAPTSGVGAGSGAHAASQGVSSGGAAATGAIAKGWGLAVAILGVTLVGAGIGVVGGRALSPPPAVALQTNAAASTAPLSLNSAGLRIPDDDAPLPAPSAAAVSPAAPSAAPRAKATSPARPLAAPEQSTSAVPASAVAVDAAASPPVSSTTSPNSGALAPGEATILLRATQALARGDAAQALVALEAHHDAFADSPRADEREALTVEALRALGRAKEAAIKLRLARTAYPTSARLQALAADAPQ